MKDYAYNVAVVFCYLVKEGKVLLIKREKPPAYRQYTIVGGKKEPGEDLYAACKREVFEETGLTVESLRLKGIVSQFAEATLRGDRSLLFRTASGRSPLGRIAGMVRHPDSVCREGISEYFVRIRPSY